MKKLLFIGLFLISFITTAQKIGVDVIKFDSITSTVRDSYTVPYGESWMIFNGTTGQFEYTDGTNIWGAFGGSTITAGTGLTESPLGTFNVANPYSGVTPTFSEVLASGNIANTNININSFELQNVGQTGMTSLTLSSGLIVPRLSTTSGVTGKIYFDTDDNKFYGYNGTSFVYLDGVTGTDNSLSEANQTITTNKLIEVPIGNLDTYLTMRGGSTELFKMGTNASAEPYLKIGDLTVDQGGTSLAYDNTLSGLTATDVKIAIDELDANVDNVQNGVDANAVNIALTESRADSIVSVLSLPSTSSFVFVENIASQTAIASDAEDRKIIFLDYNDEDYTIPSGVFDSGNSIRIQSTGTGTARILPGSGVSFAPFDGFQLDSITKSITIARINSDTAPEDWFPLDGYIKNYLDDPNVGNLFTTAFYGNLFSPNSTLAPSGLNNVSSTISQESTTVFNGTTAMDYTTGGSSANFAYFTVPTAGLSVSDSITLTFKYNQSTAGTVRRVQLYDATTGFTTLELGGTTGVWQDGSITHVIGTLAEIRVYVKGDSNFVLDNLKVILN